MSDRFEDLRTFVAVMSAGGINAAAAELGIAKSAVSRRVSDLEERLGVTLITRSTRRFQPTRAGIEYFRRAKDILASLDDLDSAASTALGWRRVVVSAPSSVIIHLLPGTLSGVVGRLSETVLSLVPDHALGRDAIEADISIGTQPITGRVNRDFATTARVACASSDYLKVRGEPATPDSIKGHVLIGIGQQSAANWQFSVSAQIPVAITVVAPDEDSAARAAVAGLGIVQLPDYVVAQDLADGRLVSILRDFMPEATKLIACCSPIADPVVREVFDAVTAPRELLPVSWTRG